MSFLGYQLYWNRRIAHNTEMCLAAIDYAYPTCYRHIYYGQAGYAAVWARMLASYAFTIHPEWRN